MKLPRLQSKTPPANTFHASNYSQGHSHVLLLTFVSLSPDFKLNIYDMNHFDRLSDFTKSKFKQRHCHYQAF